MADHIDKRRRSLRAFAGLTTVALLFAACSSSTGSAAPSGGGGAVTGSTSLGSNESDKVPKAAVASIIDYCATKTGVTTTINTSDHGKFQDSISSYLQGTPDDIVKWFSGERLKFFADPAKGLVTPIDDVWAKIGTNYADAFAKASAGNDGKKYFVPLLSYPWVVLYRKSLFTEKGYTVPKTIEEFKTLATKMKADGLVPLAFGDKDGWPAMGTFDILNMRINGYQFHADLLAGKEKWTDPKVEKVWKTWAELLPYFQDAPLGRTWQEAAQAWATKKAGMYFLGTFAGEQVPAADKADVDFFPFPTLGTEFDKEQAVDAPIDGFMLSKAPKNLPQAKAILECIGTAEAQAAYLKGNENSIAAVKNADTSAYTPQQKKMAEIIGGAGAIAQFLDRDTRADFAGPNGMQGLIQGFLKDPNQDLVALGKKIQGVYDSLPKQ